MKDDKMLEQEYTLLLSLDVSSLAWERVHFVESTPLLDRMYKCWALLNTRIGAFPTSLKHSPLISSW